VPENRTNVGWLARRGLRIGAIKYHVQRKAARTAWRRGVLVATMLAIVPLSV
jgi:hypothetical protein